MIKRYLKIWWMMTERAAQISLVSRSAALIFIVGKVFRFSFFLLLLLLLSSKTQYIRGYTILELAFFFLSYNFVDTATQFLLREVYRFRNYVVTGYFDYILTKPISPLFRSLFGGCDILDLPILLISVVFLIITASHMGNITFSSIAIYLILLVNAFLIALAFHIFVLSIGIMTTEIDNTTMLYRDLVQMGRIPVDIYQRPVSSILTFAIPVGIMMTFPAKALLGLLSWQFIAISIFAGFISVFLAIKLWKYALNQYSSASS